MTTENDRLDILGGTIDCPVCSMNTALEEEVDENTTSWMCLKCGYQSNTLMKRKSTFLRNSLDQSPQIVKDLKVYDKKRDIFWVPSTIQMQNKGMIYPEGTLDEWSWVFAPVVDVPVEEQKNFPIPGKTDEFYTKRLSTEQAQKFGKYEFSKALKEIGAIVYLNEDSTISKN